MSPGPTSAPGHTTVASIRPAAVSCSTCWCAMALLARYGMREPRARGEPRWRQVPRRGPKACTELTCTSLLTPLATHDSITLAVPVALVASARPSGSVSKITRAAQCTTAPTPANARLSESASRTSPACTCTVAARSAGRVWSLPLCTIARTVAPHPSRLRHTCCPRSPAAPVTATNWASVMTRDGAQHLAQIIAHVVAIVLGGHAYGRQPIRARITICLP